MITERKTEYCRQNDDLICENLSVSDNGHLLFAGQDTVSLAKQYGTPLYLFDEQRIRERCRTYKNAVKSAFSGKAKVLYASKAASFKRIYEIMKDENMYIDVVSSGEIRTALAAGFDLSRAYFHSNNKTDRDIEYAIDNGIGCFIVDNEEELIVIDRIAAEKKKRQAVLLRLTPGIDPHTYAAVATGKVDSKFGSAIETGQAEKIALLALSLKNIQLSGFDCHIGSQVFDSEVYISAASVMLRFIASFEKKTGYKPDLLDLGGGYGVRYTAEQPQIDIAGNIAELASFIRRLCRELMIDMPTVCLEPGRSIVADAGMTLYTVGTVKRITGYRNYVSVDGSMADNPRYALYASPYTLLPADDMFGERSMVCSVVGRCCESGDIIQPDVSLPDGTKRGNIVACLTTGAYNYSMASNYNRLERPAVVMLNGGSSYTAVRRETLDDIIKLDI